MSLFPIVAIDESTAEDVAMPAFIVARDGLYLRKRSLLGISQVQVDVVDHLPPADEYLEYALPKIPASLMGRVVGLFAAVWRMQKSEALVLLTWDGSAFGLIVPDQRAGAASVQHRLEPADVPIGVQLVGSIHSHGSMGAFASLTDEADEADFDGIHAVVGDIDQRRPSYSAAMVVNGRRFGCKSSMLLQRPRRLIDPPAEWLERIKPLPALPRPKAKPSWASRKPKHRSDGLDWDSAPAWTQRDERMLDALLSEATDVAAELGQGLTYQLTPFATAAGRGAAS